MSANSPHQTLTPSNVYKTNFPYPRIAEQQPAADDTTAASAGALTYEPDPSDKVRVEVCSELTETVRPFDVFGNAGPDEKESRQRITLIHDTEGQPIVFTVANDGRFYSLMYVDGAYAGWQALDITPPQEDEIAVVDAFDTLEIGENIHIVASLETEDEASGTVQQTIWFATFAKPTLKTIQDSGDLDTSSLDQIEWRSITNSLGDRNITSVLCCPSASTPSGFHILAGTAAQGPYAATHYLLDPTQPESEWNNLIMSGSAEELLAMQPVLLGNMNDDKSRELGVASVFRQTGGNETQVCSIEVFDEKSAKRQRSYVLQTGKLGSVNGVFSNVNPWGLTDLIVAGTKGLGFYESSQIEILKGLPILPKISFKQVVCSEVYGDPACHLAIFAISEHDELYFIEGTRSVQGNKMSFKASGIPIRTGVKVMSPQYNANSNACELLYVSDGAASGLRHLTRDPATSLWTETSVAVKLPTGTPAALDKVPVYMTSIFLSNEDGLPVREGYPIQVTCEPPMQVTCSGRSFTVNGTPRTLATIGSSGHIDLAFPVDPLMGSCLLKVKLMEYLPENPSPEVIDVDPSQRVVNMMSSIGSEADLRNAQGPDGKAIFKDESKLGDAAQLLSQFKPMMQSVTSEEDTDASGDGEKTVASWQQPSSSPIPEDDDDKDWFDKASDTAGRYLGDAIECLKIAVKSVVKFAVRVVGKVVKLCLSIAGKVLGFVIKTAAALIRTVCGFLKDQLGLDLSSLTKWCQLAFSSENAKKTQKVLISYIDGTFGMGEDFLIKNKYRLSQWLDDIEEQCKTVLPDARSPPEDKKPPSLISRIMNNPVVRALLKFNPLSWVMEAISEGLSEEFGADSSISIPSFQPIMDAWANIAVETVGKETDLLMSMFGDVIGELIGLVTRPKDLFKTLLRILSDVFYTVFDGLKTLLMAFLDAIIASLQGIRDFVNGVWKIPGLTDEWEEFSGQPFTLVNFFTYIIALGLNTAHVLFGSGDGLPLDDAPQMDWKSHSTPFIETKKMQELANQPPGPNDLIVMMVGKASPDDKTDTRWAKEILSLLSNLLRTLGGAMDAYSINREKVEAKHEQEHEMRVLGSKGMRAKNQSPLQNQLDKVLQKANPKLFPGNASSSAVQPNLTQLGRLNGNAVGFKSVTGGQVDLTSVKLKVKPPVKVKLSEKQSNVTELPRKRRFGKDLTAQKDEILEGIHKIQKVLDGMKRIPAAYVVGITGSGLVLSTVVYALKAPLPEEHSSISWGCGGANILCQIIGFGMTCLGIRSGSERSQQGGGVLLQVGSTVEWSGSLVEDGFGDLGWWEWADLVGTGFGLAASVLVMIEDPKAKTAAVICTLGDGGAAATAVIGGLINAKQTVASQEEKARQILGA